MPQPIGNERPEPGKAHVWLADLQTHQDRLGRYGRLLSEDEAARAQRYRFKADADRFTLARGILRVLLGRYLNLEPTSISIMPDANGKPALAEPGLETLQFNLSHSADMTAFAFCIGRRIGVDIQCMSDPCRTDDISDAFFCPAEARALRTLKPGDRRAAFFRCWTRKEAFIKAEGRGLAIPLRDFEVGIDPTGPVLATHWDPGEGPRWHLVDLDTPPDYAGAVAVEGPSTSIKTFRVS